MKCVCLYLTAYKYKDFVVEFRPSGNFSKYNYQNHESIFYCINYLIENHSIYQQYIFKMTSRWFYYALHC